MYLGNVQATATRVYGAVIPVKWRILFLFGMLNPPTFPQPFASNHRQEKL